jgi:hypothetical protein
MDPHRHQSARRRYGQIDQETIDVGLPRLIPVRDQDFWKVPHTQLHIAEQNAVKHTFARVRARTTTGP